MARAAGVFVGNQFARLTQSSVVLSVRLAAIPVSRRNSLLGPDFLSAIPKSLAGVRSESEFGFCYSIPSQMMGVCSLLKPAASLVHRRGLVFWFRKSVPVDLIDRLGDSDIRRSLRTGNALVARQRVWTMVLLVEDAFAVLRGAGMAPRRAPRIERCSQSRH